MIGYRSGYKHLMSSYVFHLLDNKDVLPNVWNSLHTLMQRGKTCTIRAAPISCREKTHLNDLEKRSERGRRTSTTFSLLDNHGCLTASGPISLSSLFVYMFSSVPHTAKLGRFATDSQTEFPQGEHGEDALRATGFTRVEKWGGGGGRCFT